MSAKKFMPLYLAALACINPCYGAQEHTIDAPLGWVSSPENHCGGYYLEQPLAFPLGVDKESFVEITSNQGFFSLRSKTSLEGKVTITRYGQQITANKAYLYRDPVTYKLNAVDMIGNVHLREPNTLVIGKQGHYDLITKNKSLIDILYRTQVKAIKEDDRVTVAPPQAPKPDLQQVHRLVGLTAWGNAQSFSQTQAQVYEMAKASFTTCPPIHPTWQVKASNIVLNKESGRGYATHARLYVKDIPVFYTPYINFPIDSRRKTGLLWPTMGVVSNKWGPYILLPFYWNIAPNYDMTITPGYLSKRGMQLSDKFRYLSETSEGIINLSVLPNDKMFSNFQSAVRDNPLNADPYSGNPASVNQAETNRLLNSSTTRKAFSWRDKSHFNQNWSSDLDFNYAGDDYYLRDFGSNLNEITENQLLQEGNVYYKGQHWNFTGRVQAYQTLHPVQDTPVKNQYRRFPQLILNGSYPDQPYGLEYFINNEVTHFEILNNPGVDVNPPIGNRLHTQPGISLPLSTPYFFFNPRAQLALTSYNLYQTTPTQTPNNLRRALPIFDLASGFSLYKELNLFGHEFKQTLEPIAYYTYIPYRNQSSIPIFDTTVNTLVYDQLFNYNRFTGIDRIGDANQLGLGISTRLIDGNSGLEKAKIGVGDIIYFANRRVTFCNDPYSCTDNPNNPENHRRLSPVSGFFNYSMNPSWSFASNLLWNPVSKQTDNSTINFRYAPDEFHLINLGYSYVRNGDYFSGININNTENNLKLTDISFAWPVIRDISAVGRWSQDWHTNHFQNLLYGLQYDTCCWAIRLVGGRAFTNMINNTPQYNSQFYVQVSLKGFGNLGSDPSGLLNSITGYRSQFGQDL